MRVDLQRPAARFLFGLLLGAALLMSCVAVLGTGVIALTGDISAKGDEIAYWAAGRQMLEHANPYDRNGTFQRERAVGFTADHPLMMRNPPPALAFMLPLGIGSQRASSIACAALLILGLFTSVNLAWRMDGRLNPGAYLLGYAFGPALFCILTRQMGVVVLLGLVLFLALHRSRPFRAGAALWLCMLKPHLFIPFAAVLLLWIIERRRYRLLAGLLTALAASAAFVTLLDPHVWGQYLSMMRTAGIQQEPIPCLSVAFRDAFWPHTAWLQYLPCTLGAGWALFYFRKHRDEWDWVRHGGLLMVVSLLVAPYAWFTDQAVILPALLYAAARTSRPMLTIFAVCSAVGQLAIVTSVPFHSRLFLLSMPIWLLWFLAARRIQEQPQSESMGTMVPA